MDEMQDRAGGTNGHAADIEGAINDAAGGATDRINDADEAVANAVAGGAESIGNASDETFGWTSSDASGGNDAKASGEKMLAQLQAMIDNVATQAAPVARQVGAKAAELAAVAADRAGPFAIKAADATADLSERFASRSRSWAADLRAKTAEAGDDANGHSEDGGGIAIAEAEDRIEGVTGQDPAEGPRD
jgi:hypothetical protein